MSGEAELERIETIAKKSQQVINKIFAIFGITMKRKKEDYLLI